MASPQVFTYCAVIAVSFVVVHTAPFPGLLSQFFGGEDPSQPKQAPVDINQLLRQYYLSPSEDPRSQYNPFAPPAHAALTYQQPNYAAYNDPGLGLQLQQGHNLYSNPYGSINSYGGSLGSSLGNPLGGSLGTSLGSPLSGSILPLYRGSFGNAKNSQNSPQARSALLAEDPLAANQFSQQLDSLLPIANNGGSLQNFANFRLLPSAEASDDAHQQSAEPLPSQSALQAAAPVARALADREPTQASRVNAAEEVPRSKQ